VRDLVYPYSVDDITGAIDRATRQYLDEGITSAQEAGIGAGLVAWSPRELAAYASARASGRLHVRTTLMVAADALHETGGSADDLTTFGLDLGIATGLGDETLRIGPLKIFSDGSMLGRTAAMKAPFADDPGNAGLPAARPRTSCASWSGARTGVAGRSPPTPSATSPSPRPSTATSTRCATCPGRTTATASSTAGWSARTTSTASRGSVWSPCRRAASSRAR
jgi:hypothetical protein